MEQDPARQLSRTTSISSDLTPPPPPPPLPTAVPPPPPLLGSSSQPLHTWPSHAVQQNGSAAATAASKQNQIPPMNIHNVVPVLPLPTLPLPPAPSNTTSVPASRVRQPPPPPIQPNVDNVFLCDSNEASTSSTSTSVKLLSLQSSELESQMATPIVSSLEKEKTPPTQDSINLFLLDYGSQSEAEAVTPVYISHPCNAETPEIARYLYTKLFNHYVSQGKAQMLLNVQAQATMGSTSTTSTPGQVPTVSGTELNVFLSQCTENAMHQFNQKARAAAWSLMDQMVAARQARGLCEDDFVNVARMIATWQRRGPPAAMSPEEDAILKVAAQDSPPLLNVMAAKATTPFLPYGLSLLSDAQLQALYRYRARSSAGGSSEWIPSHSILVELPVCSISTSLVGNAWEVGTVAMNSRIALSITSSAATKASRPLRPPPPSRRPAASLAESARSTTPHSQQMMSTIVDPIISLQSEEKETKNTESDEDSLAPLISLSTAFQTDVETVPLRLSAIPEASKLSALSISDGVCRSVTTPIMSSKPEHLRHVSLPGDVSLAPSALDTQFRSFLHVLQGQFGGDLSLFQRSISVFCSRVRRVQAVSRSDLSLTLSQLCWRQAPASALIRLRRLDTERFVGSESGSSGTVDPDETDAPKRYKDGDSSEKYPSNGLSGRDTQGAADGDDDDAPPVLYAGLNAAPGMRTVPRRSISGPAGQAPLIIVGAKSSSNDEESKNIQPASSMNEEKMEQQSLPTSNSQSSTGSGSSASILNMGLIRALKKRTALSKIVNRVKQSFGDSLAPQKRQANQVISQSLIRASISQDIGILNVEIVESCGISKKSTNVAFTAYIIPSTEAIPQQSHSNAAHSGSPAPNDSESTGKNGLEVTQGGFGVGLPNPDLFDPNMPPIVVPAPILPLASSYVIATTPKPESGGDDSSTSVSTSQNKDQGENISESDLDIAVAAEAQAVTTLSSSSNTSFNGSTESSPALPTSSNLASIAWTYFLQWKSVAHSIPVHATEFWDSSFALPWCSPSDVLVIDAHGGDPISLSSGSYEVLGRIIIPLKVILAFCTLDSGSRPLSAWVPLLTQQGNTQPGGYMYLSLSLARMPRLFYNSVFASQLVHDMTSTISSPVPSSLVGLYEGLDSSRDLAIEELFNVGSAQETAPQRRHNDVDQLGSLKSTISAIEFASSAEWSETRNVPECTQTAPGELTTTPVPVNPSRQSISVFCVTMNMGNAPPPCTPEELTALLPPGHMIYAVAAQECRYAPRYDWTNCRDDWAATLVQHLGTSYTMVKYHSLADIRLAVFVANELVTRVSDVVCDTVATGLGNVVGNKGAVAIALKLDHTSVCFVSSHLAAHQDKVALRNENFREVIKRTRFGRKYPYDGGANIDLVNQFDHLIFMGDLNYRIHYGKNPLARSPDEDDMRALVDMIHQGEVTLQAIAGSDQLNLERSQNRAFFGFNEGSLLFRPTYKVLPGEEMVYIADRLPAWCDRVLFKSVAGSESQLKLMAYTSAESVLTSDHKPVSACFQLSVSMHPPAKLSNVPFLLPVSRHFIDVMAKQRVKATNEAESKSMHPDTPYGKIDLTTSGQIIFEKLHFSTHHNMPQLYSLLNRVVITLEIADLGAENLLSVQERHDISEDRRAGSAPPPNAVVNFFKQVTRGLQPSATHPFARITSPSMRTPYVTTSIRNTVAPRWPAGPRVTLRTNNPRRIEDSVFNIEVLSSGPATDGALGFTSLSLRSSGVASQLLARINSKVSQLLGIAGESENVNSNRIPYSSNYQSQQRGKLDPPSLLMRGTLDSESQSASVPFRQFVTYAGLPAGEVYGNLIFHVSIV